MQIIARCPECAHSISLQASAADRRLRCPKCNRLLRIPKLEDLPKATEMIHKAKGTIYVDQDGKTYG